MTGRACDGSPGWFSSDARSHAAAHSLKLYHATNSPNSRRVGIFLAEKGQGDCHVTHNQVCESRRAGSPRIHRNGSPRSWSARSSDQSESNRHQPGESMWRNDKYVERVKFPAGLGYDAAGIVEAVGKDVTAFAVGDAVSTIPAFSLNQYSTYGEIILAPYMPL
jgi:hypothetical protein